MPETIMTPEEFDTLMPRTRSGVNAVARRGGSYEAAVMTARANYRALYTAYQTLQAKLASETAWAQLYSDKADQASAQLAINVLRHEPYPYPEQPETLHRAADVAANMPDARNDAHRQPGDEQQVGLSDE